jgi:ribonuclease VapC
VILDSSVVVAVFLRETGFEEVIDRLAAAEWIAIGTPTLVEAGMVIHARTGFDARSLLDRFTADFEVTMIDFGVDHWREALAAFRRYGKGRHAAALNFGDCLSYAVAKLAGEPLLFLGDDFSKTDLAPAG